MSSSEKPCAALLVAAGSLLVSQLAFADAPSTPSPQRSDAPLEAAAPPAGAHCVPAWVIDAAGIRQLPDRCDENHATTEIAAPDPDPHCESPSFIDARGIRWVRQECLRGPAQPAPAAHERWLFAQDPADGQLARRDAPARRKALETGNEPVVRLAIRPAESRHVGAPVADGEWAGREQPARQHTIDVVR